MLKIIYISLFFCFSFQNLFADEYFLTLRNDKVNLRQGPSFEYPIKLFYKKKFLPVLIQDKFEERSARKSIEPECASSENCDSQFQTSMLNKV